MLSIPEFAKRTGITVESVKKQMDKGHLPFIQNELRGTRYINMLQLAKRCEEANTDKAWN
jgi:hypothetical protein